MDAVIVGGGLSGLSLAAHLAAGGWGDRSVVVVDDGARNPADLAWAYWSAAPGLLAAAVSREYDRLLVNAAGGPRVVRLGQYRYRLVRGDDLHRAVAELLRDRPGFRLVTGRVEQIRDRPDGAEVGVDGGVLTARWAFDSVLGPPSPGPVRGRLAFVGWEVECDQPVFDPRVPTLFDFRTPQPSGARFIYVLPVTDRRALVEHTTFIAGPPDPTIGPANEAIRGYLADVLAAGPYRVLRTERGVLPLRTRTAERARGRVLTIGAAGGLIKASTGYGFDRIQRDSAAITRSLVRHDHPFDVPAPRRRHRFLDAVLLDVLAREPGQLPLAFGRLFARMPAESVLKFLAEDTTLAEEFRLVTALPPAAYLRAVAGRVRAERPR